MFGHKKKAVSQPHITVLDEKGLALYDGALTDLQLSEETINALSDRFFGDPEPCEIHRAAVLSRVFMELGDLLAPGAVLAIEDLEPAVRAYFADYPAAVKVTLGK